MDKPHTELLENLSDIIKDFNVAMLVSLDANNQIHARPMSITRYEAASGIIYFSTSADSGKIGEIEHDPRISVTLQSSAEFVSLSGHATVLNDRQMIQQLYDDSWKAWFPQGPDQPDIRLIQFKPDQGEYWDVSGMKGLKFLWKAGKAIARNEQVDYHDPEIHARVSL